MDNPSHLSVVIDLSLTQWTLCAQSTNPPGITLQDFLSQLLAFLNAHIACKDENTLAVFGAFPGQRYVVHYGPVCGRRSHLIAPWLRYGIALCFTRQPER